MWHRWLSKPHRLLLLAGVCCWLVASASATLVEQGQEPWLVMWRTGVDGKELWKALCPSISIGDDPQQLLESLTAAPALSANSLLRSSAAAQLALNCGARYSELFNGFAGKFTLKELDTIKALFKNSIDFVISDKPIQIDTPPAWLPAAPWPLEGAADSLSPPLQRALLGVLPRSLAGQGRRMLPEEFNATWGLDLLDQSSLPLDTIYHYTYNGTGVHVYVLDTGIRTTHTEFWDAERQASRAVHAFDAVYSTNSSDDCHGHGTHVAAIVGGNTFGVAKNVTLHAVRVLACDGTAMVSSLLKGLEWVAKNHAKPAVVHMSIEGGFSSVVNQAVEQLIRVHHVHVVVSSGNSGKDACRASPASAPSAVTVAAIDSNLDRWSYANWGACVDVFAPGVAILSAVSTRGDTGTALKTGTSMAAPFVTGVVAAYLESYPGASAEEVQQRLYQSSVRGSVGDDPQGFATLYPERFPDLTDISSTPNRLLQGNLTSQAVLTPGRLWVTNATSAPLEVSVSLSQRPSAPINISVGAPGAWDGSALADVAPAQLVFAPEAWDVPQRVALTPRPVCEGDYFLTFALTGAMEDGLPSMHTVLVRDSRTRSGDTAAMARVITRLPFNDSGDTTPYTDSYGCQATDLAPDVVYAYTPPADADVTISTCGSGFDTKLLVSTNLSDPATYVCSDDDRTCTTNTACSRLDTTLKAGTTYFFVIDGYSGASGEYRLSVTCTNCPGDPAQQQQAGAGGTVVGSSAPSSDGGSSSSSSSSSMLIQALLHLSHPAPSSRSSPSPSPGPSSLAASGLPLELYAPGAQPATPQPSSAPGPAIPAAMPYPAGGRPQHPGGAGVTRGRSLSADAAGSEGQPPSPAEGAALLGHGAWGVRADAADGQAVGGVQAGSSSTSSGGGAGDIALVPDLAGGVGLRRGHAAGVGVGAGVPEQSTGGTVRGGGGADALGHGLQSTGPSADRAAAQPGASQLTSGTSPAAAGQRNASGSGGAATMTDSYEANYADDEDGAQDVGDEGAAAQRPAGEGACAKK